jgi:hypothetical protein
MKDYSKRIFIIATALLLIGVILPLLMVVKVIESTFLLNFFSYASSLSGFILGFYGIAGYIKARRN